jgi:putative DNA-invertase from lambdoid prophage Rac
MRTFSYSRVSTVDQQTDNQELEIQTAGYVIQQGRSITEIVSGSVAAMERKQFRAMVDHKLEAGDTLVVTKIDRLGRDMIDVHNTINMLQGKGIQLVCLQIGNVDLSSTTGKLFVNMMSTFAQFERDLLIERTRAGLERAKAEGKQLGRPKALTTQEEIEVTKALESGSSVSSLSKKYGCCRQVIAKYKSV